MSDDYKLLNLGGLTSLVSNIKVTLWGNEVVLECIDDPTGDRLPYTLNFQDCREIRSRNSRSRRNKPFAELIGFHIGEGDRGKTALIHTDIFEISLLYSIFNMERGAQRKYSQVNF